MENANVVNVQLSPTTTMVAAAMKNEFETRGNGLWVINYPNMTSMVPAKTMLHEGIPVSQNNAGHDDQPNNGYTD